MKPLLRIVITGLFFFVLSKIGYAQNYAVSSATVSVTIVKPLNVQQTANLNFGVIAQNKGQITVSPKDKNAGSFSVAGKPGAQVNLTLSRNVTLHGTSGNTIRMRANGESFNTSNNQRSSKVLKNTKDNNIRLNKKNGTAYVWFGGTIDSKGAKKGTYKGNYTATIAYVDQ